MAGSLETLSLCLFALQRAPAPHGAPTEKEAEQGGGNHGREVGLDQTQCQKS